MFDELSDEWIEWIALTPLERWRESQKLFATYLAQGGTLDSDPDPDSPFYFRKHGVQTLLMGGQACVFYGAAQVSKDVSLARHTGR